MKCKQMIIQGDQKMVRKALGLLVKLMKREEKFGFGNLRSFNALKLLRKIYIHFERESKYYKDSNDIYIELNDTITQVRKRIAQKFMKDFLYIQLTL